MQLKKCKLLQKKLPARDSAIATGNCNCDRFDGRWQTDRQTDSHTYTVHKHQHLTDVPHSFFREHLYSNALNEYIYAGESLYSVVSPVEQQQTNWSLGGEGEGRTHHLPSTTTLCSEWPLKSPKREMYVVIHLFSILCVENCSPPPPLPLFPSLRRSYGAL